MSSGITNYARAAKYDVYFRAATPPTNFYLALITSANVPNEDTVNFSELTQIATGAGYVSGGISVSRNNVDFPTLTTDNANDKAVLTMKDQSFTATANPGDQIPLTGAGASYAVLTDDNATVANRKVLAWFDLGGARQVSAGQALMVPGLTVEMRKS